MLATLKYVLKIAEEKKIAIGAFNTPGLQELQAVIENAEELDLPVIIQFAQCHEPWIPLEIIGPNMVEAARKAKVPVCVHLDHGETLEYLQKALDLGFTGIMYDGSTLPYEENVANTKKAVEMAMICGASVEAEIGSMGKREDGSEDGNNDNTKIYTDPVQAYEFVKETGIDALACSFGTTHGIYLTQPRLDYNVIKNVRKLTNIPVVMHGGSGVDREGFRKSIEAGVRKVNYFTYMDKSGGSAVTDYVKSVPEENPVYFSTISEIAQKAMKENVREAMMIFANMK